MRFVCCIEHLRRCTKGINRIQMVCSVACKRKVRIDWDSTTMSSLMKSFVVEEYVMTFLVVFEESNEGLLCFSSRARFRGRG